MGTRTNIDYQSKSKSKMKMYPKSDSDTTSFDLSSPKRPAYYVQSPSRDSDKSSSVALTTHHTTTPTDSPSQSSYASRISGGGGGGFRGKGRRKYHGGRWWSADHKEEARYEDDLYGENRGISVATCRIILGAVAIFSFFLLLSSLLFAASQSFTPLVYVKGVNVHTFYYGEGSDNTGVPTKILEFKSTVEIKTHNPSTFFGIHVSSSPFKLIYSGQFTLATAQLESYYQPKQSNHTSRINLVASKVPLYGAGADLATLDHNGGVPVRLEFEIRSRANVVGNLVKSRHGKQLSCFFLISSQNNTFLKFTHRTCSLYKFH